MLMEYLHLGFVFYDLLILDPYLVVHKMQLWRCLTYAMLHNLDNIFHLLSNILLLLLFGIKLELKWGKYKFLFFILCSIFSGSLFVCFAYLMQFSVFPVIGFSAASIGLLISWGFHFSDNVMYLFNFFPISGKELSILSILIEIVFILVFDNISSSSHFGGIFVSLIFCFKLLNMYKIKDIFFNN